MSRPVEEIPLEDVNPYDEYESTVGDITGAVGGTPADTDFGGGQIQTPADRSSVRRRGSIEWERNDITEEDKDTIEDLTRRFEELRRDRAPSADIAELTEELRYSELIDINTKLSTLWKEYVEKQGNKFKIDGGATFKRGTVWSLTDEGIFVEYIEKKTRLTAAENPRKFLKPSTISKNYGRGGTSFVRNILGVVDYSSASKKTQQQAERASISLRDLPKLDETPTGRPKNARIVSDSIKKANQVAEELNTDFEKESIANREANREEINTFSTAFAQLKRQSDDYEHLVSKRDEKEVELKNLKSKDDQQSDQTQTISFDNPGYEDEEGEQIPLLPVSEEDAERSRELEAEIEELDTAITDQDAKVRNSIRRLRLSLENFIDSDDTLGSRVRELFRREGVTIASLLTAIGMTIAAVVEGIVLATKSAVSAVIPAPKPKPPGPKPDVPDTPIDPPKPPEPPKPKTWTDWFKDQLQKIANLLLKLGDKVLIALPGIIGAVLNFVLKSAGAVVGFLADHLWHLLWLLEEFYTRQLWKEERSNNTPVRYALGYFFFACSPQVALLGVYWKNEARKTTAATPKIKESFRSS